MCSSDADCDLFISGQLCRAQGECHRPYCDKGLCECLDSTGLDLDGDGVPCPADCDDSDAAVSRTVTCSRDRDDDHYADCNSVIDESPPCLVFCVEPNATCPSGYTDIADPDRFERERSTRTDGVPCDDEPVVDECDCCDVDKHVYPNSSYAGSGPNVCGNAEYNCDGTSEQKLCCSDGTVDVHNPNRYLWYANQCHEAPINVSDGCGGCETVDEAPVLTEGYACVLNCTGDENIAVAPGMCPNACDNECVCVDDDSPPLLGECAQVIVDCAHVRPALYADVEQCCVVAVA